MSEVINHAMKADDWMAKEGRKELAKKMGITL